MNKRIRAVSASLGIGWLLATSGCATAPDAYPVTYYSSPQGAELTCNGKPYGNMPVQIHYPLGEAERHGGQLKTPPCTVKWQSGATAEAATVFDLDRFPEGTLTNVLRPNVPGAEIDQAVSRELRAKGKKLSIFYGEGL